MLGTLVKVIVDRPLGSCHPNHPDICYPVNYGYIPDVMAPDGEEQDAYILGVDVPVREFKGRVIAIIHRFDDIEEKWVVAPENTTFTKEEITQQVAFQEQYFRTAVYCAKKEEEKAVQLIRAEEKDAQLIQSMQQTAFAALLDKYRDYDMSPATESLEKIRWKITHPGSYYYFILADGQTVGGIRVVDLQDGSRKRISPLYILPDFRGKGYAQAAMMEAQRIHGADHWQLDTILQEAGNCYLYEKMGYHRTGHQTVIHENMTIVDYEKD